MHYDLLVIGRGLAAQQAALAAAGMNKRVAIVERNGQSSGEVSLHAGSIRSKTVREAILRLTGNRRNEVDDNPDGESRPITMDDLRREVDQLIRHELDAVGDQLERHGVESLTGDARFVSSHEVEITGPDGQSVVRADRILIACGTRPARPGYIPFDGELVFDADEIFNLNRIPRSMIVVGGGTTGVEYATLFATLGVQVTVVDGRERLLDFCDREIVDALLDHARSLGVVFRLGEEVIGVDRLQNETAAVCLEGGEQLIGETVLVCVGRVGNTDELNLQAAGLEPDERGRLWCNEDHQTWASHIYGAGDVVGFPAQAGVSTEQGSREVCCAFDRECGQHEQTPSTLFAIPEISLVGRNEEDLTAESVPYEVDVVRFQDIPSGHLDGGETEMTKLLFHRDTRELLGVHSIGEMATEIVQIGQVVMAFGGSVDYFHEMTFNYARVAEPADAEEMLTV